MNGTSRCRRVREQEEAATGRAAKGSIAQGTVRRWAHGAFVTVGPGVVICAVNATHHAVDMHGAFAARSNPTKRRQCTLLRRRGQ